MIKGCLALEMIQSTRQFPSFTLEHTWHHSLRLPNRITPHNGHEGPHHQRTNPRCLINVWPILCMSMTVDTDIRIDLTLQRCTSLTHTIRSPMPSKDMKCRNEAHSLHQPS